MGDGDIHDLEVVESAPQGGDDYSSDNYDPADEDKAAVIVVSANSTDDCHSINDLICSMDMFSTFCDVIYGVDPELGEALSGGEWTLFAPTDQAFDDIESVLEGLKERKVKRILNF